MHAVGKQLLLAQENAKGKGKGTAEKSQLDVIKAEMALLKAKRAALGYSLKRKELKILKKKEVADSANFTQIDEGSLEDLGTDVLEEISPVEEGRPIACLAHGLDRVLFNPNVYWYQDPHSKVYNFPQELQKLPTVQSFAFDRVGGFVTSSRDVELATLANRHGKRFTGSTSSLSGFLSHIYYLLSSHKHPDISTITPALHKLPSGFSPGTTLPTAVNFKRSEIADNVYAMDSVNDKDDEGKNILTFLGTMLERYLTLPPEQFEKFTKNYEPLDQEDPQKEAYRYSKSSKFIMRSQLDCQDRRLPGSGVFDLKTRACIAIRRDRLNWEENAGYQIVKQTGILESFEREYFDLIRSAFLKFQFQVRIGGMDGVFVAYHNTEKLFGFQYIPLTEMDHRLFGSHGNGNQVFEKCVGILEALVDRIVDGFPGESVSCLVETKPGDHGMNVWYHPASVDPSTRGDTQPPIKLLRVRVQHRRDGETLAPALAISSPLQPWIVQYSIHQSHQNVGDIWKSYDEASERKQMSMYLPSGLSVEDFLKTWLNLDYGAPGGQTEGKELDQSEVANLSRKFVPAHSAIKHLRNLAKKGRLASQADEVLPKVFWGNKIEDTFETADGFGKIIFQNDSESTGSPNTPNHEDENQTDSQTPQAP